MTIDIDLQQDIEAAFAKRRQIEGDTRYDQHGAAVVLEVATDEVLAMASNPGFDPNMLDLEYPMLARDDLNLPLLNLRHPNGNGAGIHGENHRGMRLDHPRLHDPDEHRRMHRIPRFARREISRRPMLGRRAV